MTHANLAAVSRINRPEIYGERMLQRHPAARPHLSLVTGRQLYGDAGRHGLRDARLQHHSLHRAQIQAGVFQRAVGVRRQMGFRVQFLDQDSHEVNFAIITVS